MYVCMCVCLVCKTTKYRHDGIQYDGLKKHLWRCSPRISRCRAGLRGLFHQYIKYVTFVSTCQICYICINISNMLKFVSTYQIRNICINISNTLHLHQYIKYVTFVSTCQIRYVCINISNTLHLYQYVKYVTCVCVFVHSRNNCNRLVRQKKKSAYTRSTLMINQTWTCTFMCTQFSDLTLCTDDLSIIDTHTHVWSFVYSSATSFCALKPIHHKCILMCDCVQFGDLILCT